MGSRDYCCSAAVTRPRPPHSRRQPVCLPRNLETGSFPDQAELWSGSGLRKTAALVLTRFLGTALGGVAPDASHRRSRTSAPAGAQPRETEHVRASTAHFRTYFGKRRTFPNMARPTPSISEHFRTCIGPRRREFRTFPNLTREAPDGIGRSRCSRSPEPKGIPQNTLSPERPREHVERRSANKSEQDPESRARHP